MKRLLKVVGIFVSFLLGSLLSANASMSSRVTSASIPYIIVYEGENVAFDLTKMFVGMKDPKVMWALAPDGIRLELTNTKMLVISNVNKEDEGFYTFYAKNAEVQMEYRVAVYVIEYEPDYEFVSVESLFLQRLIFPIVSSFALKPDNKVCLV